MLNRFAGWSAARPGASFWRAPALVMAMAAGLAVTPAAAADRGAPQIDNSAIGQEAFRPHIRTWGLVFTLPEDVVGKLNATVAGPLKEQLLALGLETEAIRANIPHVTVVHIHNPDEQTPARMLAALPKPPGPVQVQLKKFYTTEAAKGAGSPWWLDLGVVKQGDGYETLMSYNTAAAAALAPLRDGPLPRVTGPVHARMGEAGRELVRAMGVSGVNVVKDGKEVRAHNPHNTLVYSTKPFTPAISAAMDDLAAHFNAILPGGVPATFGTVSIVELGFAGNVTREVYRISLKDGSALDVASGETIRR